MASFDAQISSLAGTDTDSESAQWMSDGAKEIINILPSELKEKCMTETTLNNSSPTMDLDGVGKILYVSRLSANSGGYRVSCREVPSMHAGLTSDSSSLLYYGTVTDPVYWIQSTSDAAILNVYPSPEATQTARVYHIGYPIFVTSGSGTLDITAQSTIPNFPDEAEYLVVLYAAIKVLQNKMNEKSSDLPSDVPSITLLTISTSLPSYTSVDSFISVPHPIAPTMSEKSVSITGTAPVYLSSVFPVVPSQTAFVDYWEVADFGDSDPGVLDIATIPPVAPSLGTVSYSAATNSDASAGGVTSSTSSVIAKADISGNVPGYTKPTRARGFTSFEDFFSGSEDLNPFGDTDPGTFSMTTPPTLSSASFTTPAIGTITVASFGTAPAYNTQSVVPDFADANTWINTEEDSEMLASRVSLINSQLQEYQLNIQNELQNFNDANVEYQAKIQENIKEAEFAYQEQKEEASLLLQKEYQEYQSKVQEYQAEVNNDVQVYSKNLDKYKSEINLAFQSWLKTEETTLQEYQLDIQNELNEFNKENVKYSANIQAELAKHNSNLQTAINNANLAGQEKRQEAAQTTDVDKFNKAQDQALVLQNEVKTMEAIIQNNNNLISKYSSELQSYQSQVSNQVQEYTQKLNRYQLELNTVYQAWAKTESDNLLKYQAELQKYSQDIQESLNKFNQENVEYQAKLQKDLQDAQLAESKEGRDLQKYSQEIASYQAQVQTNVQIFQSDLADNTADFTNNIQKYTTEVQKVTEVNQSSLAKYAQDLVSYNDKIQKNSVDYQWLQGQYTQLKQDYNQGIQILIGGGNPPQQQGER